jgi:hypothetical protein
LNVGALTKGRRETEAGLRDPCQIWSDARTGRGTGRYGGTKSRQIDLSGEKP